MAKEKLDRALGRVDLTSIVINTVIGAGIFGLPSKVYAQIGAYSVIALLVCAAIVALIVLCYAEVASRFTETGGPYLYAKEAFGSVVGFEVGWLYWIVRVATFAANCNLLVTYLGFFIADADKGITRVVLVSAVVAVITIVNIIGVRESAVMTNVFTVGKLLPLLIFSLVGLFFVDPSRFDFSIAPQYDAFSSAVLLLIYAFVGFEAAVVLTGETKEPQRTVPFSLIVALAIVAVFYVLIQIVSIGTLPGLAASERPLADAAAVFLGPIGAAIITVGALISIFGNLNVGVLSSTRMLYAMGEQRDLPQLFERVHPRFKTPYISIILTSAVILLLTIQTTFLTAVAIATITRLIVYATTCLALPVFRRDETRPAAPFQVSFGITAALLSIALIIWLLTNIDFGREGFSIAAAAVVGLILYAVGRRRQRQEAN